MLIIPLCYCTDDTITVTDHDVWVHYCVIGTSCKYGSLTVYINLACVAS